MINQSLDIPDKMSVLFGDTIWKAIDFFGLQQTVFLPSDDVPTGGSADVDCQIVHKCSFKCSIFAQSLKKHDEPVPLYYR